MSRESECYTIIDDVTKEDLEELQTIPDKNIFPSWWNETKEQFPKCHHLQCLLPVCFRKCESCNDNSCGDCQWSCYLHRNKDDKFEPIRQCQCIFTYFLKTSSNDDNFYMFRCDQFSLYGLNLYPKSTLFCAKHKPVSSYFSSMGTQNCLFYDINTNLSCSVQSSFQAEDVSLRLLCAKHLQYDLDISFVNTKHQKCKINDCYERAYYGFEMGIPLHCLKHTENQEFNVTLKYCEFEGCTIAASFGLEKTNKRQYCKKHAERINNETGEKIIQPIYQDNYNCIKCKITRASFGEKGLRAIYCTKCNPDKSKFINLYQKTCVFQNCNSYASFAEKDSKLPIYCTAHYKSFSMQDQKKYENVRKKLCEECDTTASYGDPETKTSTHCAKHKKEGYVLLKGSKCEICQKSQANYCSEGGSKKRFCKKCLPQDLSKSVKIKKPTCIFIDPNTKKSCDKRRIHGFPGYAASHCKEHRWEYIFPNGDKVTMCCDSFSRKHKLTENGYRILPCVICRDDQQKIFNKSEWKCIKCCDNK